METRPQEPMEGAPRKFPASFSEKTQEDADRFFRMNPDAGVDTPEQEETSH